MLNISPQSIKDYFEEHPYSALRMVESRNSDRKLIRSLLVLLLLGVISLFLPWTQYVRAPGYVTTTMPAERPQDIPSILAGRIEKWYVREGDQVNEGDTLLKISEVKDSYWDPQLLERTQAQVDAKVQAIGAYENKVGALEDQVSSLNSNLRLKTEQNQVKLRQELLSVQIDSAGLVNAENEYLVAQNQLDRANDLYEKGLISRLDHEKAQVKKQQTEAKRVSAENKLLDSRNKVINARIELSRLQSEFNEKIAKAQSEKFSTVSLLSESQAELAKMQNQLKNYEIRQGFYFVKAPQDGFVTQTLSKGLGETLKEGEAIATLMPANYELAIEMYVQPIDLPLIQLGQKVRVNFDGWPAIVFSGWPELSAGTFGAEVFAVDRFSAEEGKFRVLLKPDPEAQDWPELLRVGSGANTLTLLKRVPLWYELWRRFNGFPADFYETDQRKIKSKPKGPKLK